MKTVTIVGAGRQGKAIAYDLLNFKSPEKIVLVDRFSASLNQLKNFLKASFNRPECKIVSICCDLANDVAFAPSSEFVKSTSDSDILYTAAHYNLNLRLTQYCAEQGINMVDLGGNTDVVLKQHQFDDLAKKNGVTIIPDCGLMPGLGSSLANELMKKLDRCDSIKIRCGGLPQEPKPPLYYALSFSLEGLTNEYTGSAVELRAGQIVEIPTFADLEPIVFEPLGELECFTTSGGSSTSPYTYAGKMQTWNYKTVRYKGHFQLFKAALELGLLDLKPIKYSQMNIIPRSFFHEVIRDKIVQPNLKDLVVLRVVAAGEKDQRPAELSYDLIDYFEAKSKLSAMERLTGFHAALSGYAILEGKTEKGVLRLETAIDGQYYIDLLKNRDIQIQFKDHSNGLSS